MFLSCYERDTNETFWFPIMHRTENISDSHQATKTSWWTRLLLHLLVTHCSNAKNFTAFLFDKLQCCLIVIVSWCSNLTICLSLLSSYWNLLRALDMHIGLFPLHVNVFIRTAYILTGLTLSLIGIILNGNILLIKIPGINLLSKESMITCVLLCNCCYF